MSLPFVLVRDGAVVVPVLLSADGTTGLDVVDLRILSFDAADVVGAVSIDPAAVFWGLELALQEASRLPMAAESRTQTHPEPKHYGGVVLPPPLDPVEVPQKHSIEFLAAEFLAAIEGEGNYLEDERVPRIAAAVASLGIRTYTEVLGAGSFGTAASLSDGRVLKITTDPTEVQAGAVLVGKELKQVVKVYGAWFIQGVTANGIVGWVDSKGEQEIRKPVRVGVLLEERVLDAKSAVQAGYMEMRELNRIKKIVGDEKWRLSVWPHQLMKLGKTRARARLLEASQSIEEELRRFGQRSEVAMAVADALLELREHGIYAIDVHPGNIGYSEEDMLYKIFDIGSSSPPPEPKAGVLKSHHVPLVEGAAPDVEVGELASEAPPKRAKKYAPQGYRFAPMPSPLFGESPIATGFPEVQSVLLRHRAELPSLDTIRLSGLFAVSTVRTSIEQAEKSFNCFVELYEARGRQLPPVEAIRDCFRGLQNSKSKMFSQVAAYAPVVRAAMESGLKDRALRRHLLRETDLPVGLGVSKMSFTLALLGQDTVCLDARILTRIFGSRDKATKVEEGWGKSGQRVSELSLARYEAVEDSFLNGNPFYRASHPLGRARAQWMSWEAIGGAPASHQVWLRTVR